MKVRTALDSPVPPRLESISATIWGIERCCPTGDFAQGVPEALFEGNACVMAGDGERAFSRTGFRDYGRWHHGPTSGAGARHFDWPHNRIEFIRADIAKPQRFLA